MKWNLNWSVYTTSNSIECRINYLLLLWIIEPYLFESIQFKIMNKTNVSMFTIFSYFRDVKYRFNRETFIIMNWISNSFTVTFSWLIDSNSCVCCLYLFCLIYSFIHLFIKFFLCLSVHSFARIHSILLTLVVYWYSDLSNVNRIGSTGFWEKDDNVWCKRMDSVRRQVSNHDSSIEIKIEMEIDRNDSFSFGPKKMKERN